MTFVIVLGNHSNYTTIETNYPLNTFKGARCRYLRKNIVCIERGEIVELCGKKCWCFGGAYSVDKGWRTPEENWWYREQPNQKEMDYGFDTFCEHKDEIDFIFTHDAPATILKEVYGPTAAYPSKTERFLEKILWKSEGEIPHYCGHLHFDAQVGTYNFFIMYHKIKQIV